jgi:DNA-binding transcriptional MerR regulator
MVDPASEFLSIGGVAELVGVSASALRKWEAQGKIPAPARLAGCDRRVYRITDLDAIRARATARAEPSPRTRPTREGAAVA